jgi:hypothetical protein
MSRFSLLRDCYLTGQMSERQLQEHMRNKRFAAYFARAMSVVTGTTTRRPDCPGHPLAAPLSKIERLS